MRIVWIVVNDAFKQIATFEYTQKDAAEAREGIDRTRQGRSLRPESKEPMPDDAPGLGAAIPRPVVEVKVAAAKESVALEDEEEIEDDDDVENEVEEEDDEE